MVLTKQDIIDYVTEGKLGISPQLDRFQLQAHSVDLRLGFTFLVPKSWHVTKKGREQLHMDYYAAERPDYFDIVELEKGQFFDLLPGEHILVSSLESVKLPIRNNTQSQTVRLYPGERFCQIVFQKLTSDVDARKSRYHRKDIIEGVDVDSLDEERQVEIDLISSGDIRNLKNDYAVIPKAPPKKK
jgi:deoxycytidine triphosphate deaminase